MMHTIPTWRRHEVRDEGGNLVAVIDIVHDEHIGFEPSMAELAADVGGAGYRMRLFPFQARWPRVA
jgi:hypothetical protein